ncbi:Ferroporti-1 [Mycena rosella]|uniref:Solute carrier family 40 member n=1 Tax=Mycena rosella TaxID=1033263 RepID=A0AAD7DSK4_MYCRO|nr:Ferroporti-1 [Mycena rosella]
MEDDDVAAESTPLLTQNADNLDPLGVKYLLVQHFSSAWGDRTAEFALYLYLIAYFKDTLLPSSIFGFSMTLTGILFSRWAGSVVDKMPKLSVVRWSIFLQKASTLGAYTCVAGLRSVDNRFSIPSLCIFSVLVLAGCILQLSTTCMSIAVERDWTACISAGSSPALAKINTYLRQINLLCKLLAPLFVSFLTVKYDSRDDQPSVSIAVLAVISILTMVFEMYWIQIVYDRFPMLAAEQQRKDNLKSNEPRQPQTSSILQRALNLKDWQEFVRLPVFLSSVSISLLYLTVLSFEGTMLGYLKTLDFRDDFLAGMRGLCVVTGLIGTLVTVPLERKLGSARAGSWSIWSMVVCLLPVMASFYIFGPRNTLGAGLLFGGMALSRVGLWSFDLIQTKQLQDALSSHARRNTLTALQLTMQSVADLLKYVLTMVLSRPSQFRWAGLVSFVSVSSGAVVYLLYLRKERGHIFHPPLEWIRKIL